jgi:DNA polymerase-3 subunit gamma/tau
MLPSVLRRCLQFNLRPMAPATVREHLHKVLSAENVPFDEGSLRLLARAANGSMRDGLSLTDQAIAYGGGRLEQAGVRAMLGSVDRGHAKALVHALAQRDAAATLAQVDGLRALGLSAAATLEEVALLLQQMAVEQMVPGALDSEDPDCEAPRELAPLLPADETQFLYSLALHGRAELNLMGDEYAALSMVLLRFLAFPPAGRAGPEAPREQRSAPLRSPAPPAMLVQATGPGAAAARTPLAATLPATAPAQPTAPVQPMMPAERADRAPAGLLPTSAPASAPSSAAAPAPGGTDASAPPAAMPGLAPAAAAAFGDRWAALVNKLSDSGALNALLREVAWQAGLQAVEDSGGPARWLLTVEREPLRSPALAEKLSSVLSTELGAPLQVVLQPGVPADSPAKRDAAERARRQAQAEDTIHNDPVVKALLAQFKTARVVPGSVKPV